MNKFPGRQDTHGVYHHPHTTPAPTTIQAPTQIPSHLSHFPPASPVNASAERDDEDGDGDGDEGEGLKPNPELMKPASPEELRLVASPKLNVLDPTTSAELPGARDTGVPEMVTSRPGVRVVPATMIGEPWGGEVIVWPAMVAMARLADVCSDNWIVLSPTTIAELPERREMVVPGNVTATPGYRVVPAIMIGEPCGGRMIV